MKSGSVRIH